MTQVISMGVAVLGRYYDTEENALKAVGKKEVIVEQGNNFIIISETQAKKLKK